MVELNATRTIAQARDADARSLAGVRFIELSCSSSDAAAQLGIDIAATARRFEDAMRTLGVRVTNVDDGVAPGVTVDGQAARVAIRIEVMETDSPAAIAVIRRSVDRFKSMRSVRPLRPMGEHEAVITWQGLEIGAERGDTFDNGASAALSLLLTEFADDFRKANPAKS
jgi:hypothetical protein